jgi:hypothetical protein
MRGGRSALLRVRRTLLWVIGAVAVLVAVAVALLGLLPGVMGRYRTSTPALAVAYRAKETCSCVFVEGRDEEFCRAWTVATPDIAHAEVDHAAKVVRARAFWLWRAQARFVGEGKGCVAE